MPTRVCSGALDFSPPTAWINSSPARTARSASSSWACGIAEIDQHAVAHILRHEPAEALHSLGDAFLIGGNDLAQVLRVHARGECCRTDEVREHHRDLAALGGVLRGLQEVSRGLSADGASRSRQRAGQRWHRAAYDDVQQYRHQGPSGPRLSGSARPSRRSRSRGKPPHNVRGQGSAANPRCP